MAVLQRPTTPSPGSPDIGAMDIERGAWRPLGNDRRGHVPLSHVNAGPRTATPDPVGRPVRSPFDRSVAALARLVRGRGAKTGARRVRVANAARPRPFRLGADVAPDRERIGFPLDRKQRA